MPLPSPQKQEKRSEFVSRCIGDDQTAKDFPDQKQRIAICYTQWDSAKKEATAVVGSGDNEVLFSAQKTYGGKKRSELKNSDFLYPNERSFPIVTPVDVKDAVSSFGRSKGKDYNDFKRRLVKKVRSRGADFVKALPQSIKDEYKIKASEDTIEDYQAEFLGMSLSSLKSIKARIDSIFMALEADENAKYNLTEPWLQGKIAIIDDNLKDVADYILFTDESDEDETESETENEDTMDTMETEDTEETENESGEETENETEEYMTAEDLTVDNLYIPEESEYVSNEEIALNEADTFQYDIAKERPGLWENIRRKKKREGKNYKPAKVGDKDRPSPDAWEKAQGAEYQGSKVTLNRPFRTPNGPKKFAVYTKNESGNVVIVRFGDPNMEIKRDIPQRRENFRSRHNCDNPGPKWKARYWSCQWSWSPSKKVGA
jgi:hypothetical protein